MKRLFILGFTIIMLIVATKSAVHAQNSRSDKKYMVSTAKLKKKKAEQYMGLPISFLNLGEIFYYSNTKDYKLINKAIQAKDYAKALPLLEAYVSQFGIENFNRDSELLWQLGQAYENLGRLAEAKTIYRLVIKHKESDIKYIWQYYDEIVSLDKEYYVPIEYYYELLDYRRHIDTLRPPRGVLVNMGESVNSVFEDYGPALNVQNNMMMFSSKRNRIKNLGEEFYNEDLYYSKRLGEKSWVETKPFEGEINSPYNEGSPCLSRDGSTLFFVRCNSPDSYGNCDIFTATKNDDGTWGKVKNLGVNVNTSDWDSHPSLSHTEDTLLFVSDREGGFGATDIYFTTKDKNGKWSQAQNMGPVINTREIELSPFYHPEYNVLYFSSNSQILNFGHFDIFKTYLFNNQWSEPKNIGPLVNGQGDEYYFAIDAKSEKLFYARSEMDNMNNLDLFSFPLPMEGQPNAITKFMGSLTDSITGNPFEGIVSVIDLDNGIEVAPKYIRPDGSFEFDLIDDNRYLLIIQGEEFFRIEKEVMINGDTVINIKTPSIDFKRIEFTSVEFLSNSSEILVEMRPDLDKLMNYMVDNPKLKLVISGHTDSNGNEDDNIILSQERADAIRQYIIKKGMIHRDRIVAIGYGNSKPIIKDEQTEEERWINRRVEFEIIKSNKEWKQELKAISIRL